MSEDRISLWRRFPPLITVLLLAGCNAPDTHIVLEMRAAGTRLERHLEAFQIDARDTVHHRHLAPVIDAVFAERLARVYGIAPDTLRPYVVTKRFKRIPADLDNFGEWHGTESPLGAAYQYSERFGGDPRPAETLAAQQRSADTLLALVRAGCDVALPPGNHWPRLSAYLDRELPRDVHELVLLSWLGYATNDPDAEKRSDFFVQEHPGMIAAGRIGRDDRTLGLFFALPSQLDDGHRRMRERWLDQCEAYLAHPERMSEDDIETPEPDTVACAMGRAAIERLPGYPGETATGQMVLRACGSDRSGVRFANDLEVRLVTGIAPMTTNGKWDSIAAAVTWPVNTALSEPGVHPQFCEATWAMPDSAAQIARFGVVRVQGDRLNSYCSWYQGLTPAHRGEWDRMMATVRPGDPGPIERFRFSDERVIRPEPKARPVDSAGAGREAILGPGYPGE